MSSSRRDRSGISGGRWSVLGGAGDLGCVALVDVAHLSSNMGSLLVALWMCGVGSLLFTRAFLRGIVGLLVAAPRSWMALALQKSNLKFFLNFPNRVVYLRVIPLGVTLGGCNIP